MVGWYPHAKFKEKECLRCGHSFTPRSGYARYCSSDCRLQTTNERARKSRSMGPPYHVWWNMVQRCTNEETDSYPDYGGRGIQVCSRWLDSPEAFYEDMGPRPSGFQLDRIDPDGDYCPENCRWVGVETQQNNKRSSRLITFRGETLSITQWARRMGAANSSTLAYRLRNGWSVEKTLTTPIGNSGPKRKEVFSHGESS